MYICDMCGQTCISVYVWCTYLVCVHAPSGKTFSALLLVGPGDMELRQPHLLWAVGSGTI